MPVEIVVIAAIAAKNRVIGIDGHLPWSIPEDLQRFQRLTLHQTVVIGRRTWQENLHCRPLRDRAMIVLSSQPLPTPPGVRVADSLTTAIALTITEQLFIAGGSRLYAEGLTIADRWELTLVEGDYAGDTIFPPYDHLIGSQFDCVKRELHVGYCYETYQCQRCC